MITIRNNICSTINFPPHFLNWNSNNFHENVPQLPWLIFFSILDVNFWQIYFHYLHYDGYTSSAILWYLCRNSVWNCIWIIYYIYVGCDFVPCVGSTFSSLSRRKSIFFAKKLKIKLWTIFFFNIFLLLIGMRKLQWIWIFFWYLCRLLSFFWDKKNHNQNFILF